MTMKGVFIRLAAIVVGVPVVSLGLVLSWMRFQDRTNGTLIAADGKREFLLHVPASYDRTRPTPLVISLHGAAGWPAQQANTSGWNRLADEQGFLVVYPSGNGFPHIWHPADSSFIGALIDSLTATYHVDPRRIFVNGLSQGGGMTFVLSCTLSSRIAAVGLVAAAEELPWNWCADHRPMPMISFHGTADPIVRYAGGRNPIGPGSFPSVLDWTAHWAQRNRCAAVPTDSAIGPTTDRREYTQCAGAASVVLYTVRGGGHQWPGGRPLPEWLAGPPAGGVDATRLMWAFFQQHPRAP